ncbi:hypothetical protein ROTAS13_04678 [Roseomonas sp. TAS13]|nr:hypothetical protein ROTAS13_04678 [Roseomonas sp. TAS13]
MIRSAEAESRPCARKGPGGPGSISERSGPEASIRPSSPPSGGRVPRAASVVPPEDSVRSSGMVPSKPARPSVASKRTSLPAQTSMGTKLPVARIASE